MNKTANAGYRTIALAVFATLSLFVASCGSDSAESGGGDAPDESSASEWAGLELTDVEGETFKISDFEGTPVLVENFATWCGNCLKQLEDTQAAAAEAGDGGVFLALSVETDLDAESVADYAEKNGFDDVRFAVMTPEFLAATQDAFGNSSLNPPSTPKILVDAEGNAGGLKTGFESPEEILGQLESAA